MDTDAAISFNNVTVNGNTATVGEMQVLTRWEWEDIYGTQRHTTNMHPSSAPFQKVSDNVWRWTKTDGSYPDETITITLVSPTTAVVKQELNPKTDVFVYRLVTSFTITKQNSNPSTTYDLSVLDGMWSASEGSGTWGRTLSDGPHTWTLTLRDGGSYAFGDIHISDDNNAVLAVSCLTQWEYDDSSSSGTSYATDAYSTEVQVQRVSGNTWKYVKFFRYENEIDDESVVSMTLTITSPTTAEIREESYTPNDEEPRWTNNYKLTKRNSTTPSLNGTWRISSGTMTYSDGSTTNYTAGSSSPATFMLALHETGTPNSYVLDIVGNDINRKEGCPYVNANFANEANPVRVLWGTSENWQSISDDIGSMYSLTDSTYSTTFLLDYSHYIHDVTSADFRLIDSSTIQYTERYCVRSYVVHFTHEYADVELTLKRVE